jgi:predicted glutamine amidotransferase
MCKLLIMTGITEGLVAQEFMKRMAEPMSKSNPHGIGYSAVGPDGELFSERWHNNNHFFETKDIMTPDIAKALAPYANRLPEGALNPNYSTMGKVDFSNVRSVTMHTRFATCGREFANTHPFIYEDTSLIHNGTIRNAFSSGYSTGLDVNKISTCDSESALQTYLEQGVNIDTAKAKSWLDILTGSWAFGILSRNAEGNRILDVVRGTSFLYFMQIEGVGRVFTTNDDDAKAVVKDMGLKFIEEPFLVKSDEMYRYDAITGEFLETVDIKPPVRTYNSNYSGGNYQGKNGGRTTTTSTTSTSPSNKSSQSGERKRAGDGLIALVDGLRDDPDAMSVLPDIFTEGSNAKNLTIDFRKVKKYGNNLAEPISDRLDVFDMVFNTSFLSQYESFPQDLRDYVSQVDEREGLKAARSLITQLWSKRSETVG